MDFEVARVSHARVTKSHEFMDVDRQVFIFRFFCLFVVMTDEV